MPDFDELFQAYLTAWYHAQSDDMTPDEMEDKLPELYDEWANAPSTALGNVSPAAYVKRFTTPGQLLECFVTGGAPALLIDRIGEVPGAAEQLSDALSRGKLPDERIVEAMNVLLELSAPHPLLLYAGWLIDPHTEEAQRELAAEILAQNAAEAAPHLFPLIERADAAQKCLIAQVLVNAPKDERTFELLREQLLANEAVPLYAGFAAKYDDERLAAALYARLDDCDYLGFVELRNAIEALGGTVDEAYRDFSDDPYYKLVKGIT